MRVFRGEVEPVIRNATIRRPVSQYIMNSSANMSFHIFLSVPSVMNAPVTIDERALVRGTQFSPVIPIGREFLNLSDMGGAHPRDASQGLPVSLKLSDTEGALLKGAFHWLAGEEKVGLMKVEVNGRVPIKDCNVHPLLLDDLHDIYSAVEDFRERVTLNERNMLKHRKYTTVWMKRSGPCKMSLNLACSAWSNHGTMGLVMLLLHRSFLECIWR